MGPRAGLDALGKRKLPCLCWDSKGPRGGAVGSATALQNRQVAVSIPDGYTGTFIDLILPGRAMTLGWIQPLTEMSTRNIS